MRIKPWMRYASTICLYLFLSGMIVIGISEKRNLHTDEVLTYILANNSYDEEITLAPEMGKTYDPAASPWMNVMTVQQNQRFDYENVWKKQAADVHPPLYYTLVHTVCSLFPGVYSKWFGASVNLVFGLFTLYVTRKLVRALTGQEWIVFLCSVFFLCFIRRAFFHDIFENVCHDDVLVYAVYLDIRKKQKAYELEVLSGNYYSGNHGSIDALLLCGLCIFYVCCVGNLFTVESQVERFGSFCWKYDHSGKSHHCNLPGKY